MLNLRKYEMDVPGERITQNESIVDGKLLNVKIILQIQSTKTLLYILSLEKPTLRYNEKASDDEDGLC